MDGLALAMGHHQRGELAAAEAGYRDALRTDPRHPDALHLLGVVTAQRGDFATGAEWIRRALEAQPGTAVFAQNLAGVLVNLSGAQRQQSDYTGAGRSLREALQLVPDFWPARLNLGNLLAQCGHRDEAETHLRVARHLQPDRADVAHALGMLLHAVGQVTEAEPLLRHALNDPTLRQAARHALGNCLKDQGRIDEALVYYEEALRDQPDWTALESDRLNTLLYSATHTPEFVADEHRRWGERISRAAATERDAFRPEPWKGHRKLRIGYGSPDFRKHAVAFFFEPLLENQDRSQVEIFCYAYSRQRDAVTTRLQSHGDTWRCLDGLSDSDAAALIRRDQLDVFIDLAGHTASNRLPMLARRVAPAQATMLGYTHTTGLPEIDFRLTDAASDPPGAERFHVETLLRLPRPVWCYRPLEESPPVGPAPCVETGHLTFGCFNRWEKIGAPTRALWREILRRCPGSHLLLKTKVFADHAFAARVLEEFARDGIAPERIEFADNNQSTQEHLRHFQRVDIALDPHPFGGGTTTMESLWMGVPVISWIDDAAPSRLSASYLDALGLHGDCLASSPQEYIEKACALANRTDALIALRRDLRARIESSPLCDGPGYARAIEAACREMAQR